MSDYRDFEQDIDKAVQAILKAHGELAAHFSEAVNALCTAWEKVNADYDAIHGPGAFLRDINRLEAHERAEQIRARKNAN